MEAYEAATKGDGSRIKIAASRTKLGTVNDAIVRYLASQVFAALAPSTRAMRRAVLERLRSEHGDKRIGKLEAEHVKRLLTKMRPWAQRNWLKTLRGLAAFCLTEHLIDTDPTDTVKLAKAKDTGGFEPWPLAAIHLYRAFHPLGTRPRLALELLYGTMAARSDMVRLGPQHVQGGIISFRRRKTTVAVDIPMLPELAEATEAMPKAKHLAFLVTERGQPFTAAGFGNWFRDRCNEAGIPDLSAHGLRKAGATRLGECGATDHEIMSWGGWKTLREVQRYTEAANRKRLALRGADKIKSGTELSNLGIRFANEGEKS
jgi:integrase